MIQLWEDETFFWKATRKFVEMDLFLKALLQHSWEWWQMGGSEKKITGREISSRGCDSWNQEKCQADAELLAFSDVLANKLKSLFKRLVNKFSGHAENRQCAFILTSGTTNSMNQKGMRPFLTLKWQQIRPGNLSKETENKWSECWEVKTRIMLKFRC